MTNPTPTTRERAKEKAESLMLEIYGYENKEEMYEKSGHTAHDDVDRIAAALARERREAMERAAEYIRQNYHQHTGDYIDSAPEQLARAIEALE